MKVAYIAHPIAGDIKGNLQKVIQIGRQINLQEPDTIPFSQFFFDDTIPEERQRGIKNDTALLKKGFIDEVRLYGSQISKGMKLEIELAHELEIPVIPMTEGTKIHYEAIKEIRQHEAIKKLIK